MLIEGVEDVWCGGSAVEITFKLFFKLCNEVSYWFEMNIVNVININYERFVVELSGDACVVGSRRVDFWNLIF